MKKIKRFIVSHKIISVIALAALAYGSYWEYARLTSTTGQTRYVVASVQKGTIITSVSGTGQVSASNQIDLKPKASGDIIAISVADGQHVGAGAVIVQLDSRGTQKALRDAEANLQSAQLALQKLQKPVDELSLTQSENSLSRAKESKDNAQADLAKAYDAGFNTVANAFLDLPTIMTGLQNALFTTTPASLGAGSQWTLDYYAGAAATYDDLKANQYKDDVNKKFKIARDEYDTAYTTYKATSRSSDTATIEAIISRTYDTTRSIAEAVKSANNLIQFYEDKLAEHNLKPASIAALDLANLNTSTGQTNTHLVNLIGTKTAIQNDKDAITNAERTIIENTQSLAKLKAGTDPLDIQSAELTIKQRENALLDSRDNLADYTVRAPFDGIIAKLNVKKTDAISAGTVITTLITRQKIAQISLNEVDVAKIKIGEKATLTFDAIEDLSITGEVVQIDTIGTVTQGVVTYSVKISFDTQDDRVKSGMSVSSAIITKVKQDVLTIPNSAVKTQNGASYVEVLDVQVPQNQQSKGVTSATTPQRKTVEVGLLSDTATEITSGIKEGDQIITRTITPSATTAATTQAPSLFGTGGGGNRGGGIPRGN